MPALPAVNKVVRFDFLMTKGGNSDVRNHLFFEYTGAMSSADIATLALTAANSWNTNMASLFEGDVNLFEVIATDLTSNTSPQSKQTVSHAGTRTGNTLPAGTAFVVRFTIARRYRGGHPRIYLAIFDTLALATSETWGSTPIAQAVTGVSNWVSGIQSSPPAAVGTLAHCNVSYFSGFHNVTLPSGRTKSEPTLRSTPQVDVITGYVGNPKVASQRRRNLQ